MQIEIERQAAIEAAQKKEQILAKEREKFVQAEREKWNSMYALPLNTSNHIYILIVL